MNVPSGHFIDSFIAVAPLAKALCGLTWIVDIFTKISKIVSFNISYFFTP